MVHKQFGDRCFVQALCAHTAPEEEPLHIRLFSFLGTKKHGNGNVQANIRANDSGQFEGTAHKNVGFRGKKGQKVHPNFAPNITILFALP